MAAETGRRLTAEETANHLANAIYEWFRDNAHSGYVLGKVDSAAIEGEFDLRTLAVTVIAQLSERPRSTPSSSE